MIAPTSTQLTPAQEQALQALLARIPGRPAQPDALQTWLGISKAELSAWVQKLLTQRDRLEAQVLDWTERRPLDAIFEFLGSAALALYIAEKDVNPKISSYVDAFYYIATCASVGYADMFAVTQTGRTIASLVMTVGPALTSHALDRPAGR